MKILWKLSAGQKALLRKDFTAIWKTPLLRNTLLAFPIVLTVMIPAVFLIITCIAPARSMVGLEKIFMLLPKTVRAFSERQLVFYTMTSMLAPMLFLTVPLLTSAVTASSSFVGEKERGTIETLLLTPMTVREIFRAKVEVCVRLSLLVTVIALMLFGITAGIGDMILKLPFWFNGTWAVVIFLLAPALTVLGVVFMVLVSGHSKSYMEAMQTSGYIVLPLILLFVGQFTGLFVLGTVSLLMISLVIIVLDMVLFRVASRKFTPEKLLKK